MVSIIIPAYNEEKTVGAVVRAALSYPGADEVLVVDDGSTDGTSKEAETAGATVIRLLKNSGKASAMDAGVRSARSGIVVFLDADVRGLDAGKIARIAGPVIDGTYDMYVGVRARKTLILNALLRIFPILGGERALTKALWEAVPTHRKKGFEIEISLNYAAKQTEKGMGFELVSGVANTIKERKYGLALGFVRRLKMCWQVLYASIEIYVGEPIRRLFAAVDKA